MQFSDNLCHFIKMRPTIEKVKNSLTYSNTRTGGSFSAPDEILQMQWHTCLICGNYLYKLRITPENILCKDIKHSRYNYDENLKEEIQHLIKLIEHYDKCDDLLELNKKNKKLLAVLSIKLADDQIMNWDDHNNLLRKFSLHDQVIS